MLTKKAETSMSEVPSKPWLVQKYGGTSVGKLLSTITDSIIPSNRHTHRIAVVCSARSEATKSEGTTSLLLKAIRLAAIGTTQSNELNAILDAIKHDHINAAPEAVGPSSAETSRKATLQIKKDCEKVRTLLNATLMLGEISERTADRVLALGETLSCRIVAATLESQVRECWRLQ